MELGEKIRRLRLEAGLSQRQLCGERITRNMLSQIEHGAARPSMETLVYLAGQLGKPVSWFLDEDTVTSPNQAVLARAREAWERGDGEGIRRALETYRGPDDLFDWEARLLGRMARLMMAQKALETGRRPYAVELLGGEPWEGGYCAEELEGKRRCLLARAGAPVELPKLDQALLLRAEVSLGKGDHEQAARLLDAAENRDGAAWNYLRGRCYLAAGAWTQAAACLHRAEEQYPAAVPLLEECYRQLGDYRRAYEYACKGR